MTNGVTTAPVVRAVHVRVPPDVAFRLFTAGIASWWPLRTHGCFGAEAADVSFVDGRLVERSQDGTEAVWGTVLEWDPPRRFAITWHPGHPETRATTVDVEFAADDDGTRVVLTHHGWEVLGDDAAGLRDSYDGGWVAVLGRYVAATA